MGAVADDGDDGDVGRGVWDGDDVDDARRDISMVESLSLRSEAGNTGVGDLTSVLPLNPSPGPPTSTTDSESEESSTVCPEILSLSRETVEI